MVRAHMGASLRQCMSTTTRGRSAHVRAARFSRMERVLACHTFHPTRTARATRIRCHQRTDDDFFVSESTTILTSCGSIGGKFFFLGAIEKEKKVKNKMSHHTRCPVPQYNRCVNDVCYLYCPFGGSHMAATPSVRLQGNWGDSIARSTSSPSHTGGESSSGPVLCITSEGMRPCMGGS